ncbi:glycosyltransferase family 2 protein [Alicyclobacillus cycloheptanicus]|uniref:Glycosyltransferase involved in cell wall biosynthesis n=1 Tax=Alicyclobacillus cycloheptanicus TaxID=1457 RepID=A0ABT9XII3_9BACL|nr:glycosyltransferase family 2 protein [Alicyclobacillus cycloheptanicus]MDQ0190116.1 glycosyltransferase involved in cell wall biosynthesis [Alicyclobacillus cycloheptanicus]WDM02088.1 glycosyltransferase family 2 protein [Alicyclobacillus cycloheptanicus]
MSDTLIVVPAYNESANIEKSLSALLAKGMDADILVIDDGSSDDTARLARQYPVTVISHPCNLGYGTTLQTGYKYALSQQYSYVIQYDADGQHNADDVVRLREALRTSGADLAIGSRFAGDPSFRPGALKLVAIRWFRLLIYVFTRKRISDPTSGLRGLSRRLLYHYARSTRFPEDFPDADFVTDVLLRRWMVVEVPIGSHEREQGQSMHAGWKPLVYMGKVTLSMIGVALNHLLGKRGVTT